MNLRKQIIKHYKDYFDLDYTDIKLNEENYIDINWAVKMFEEIKQRQEAVHNDTLVSDIIISWEQFKKANWYESESIDVEKMLMDKFQELYRR